MIKNRRSHHQHRTKGTHGQTKNDGDANNCEPSPGLVTKTLQEFMHAVLAFNFADPFTMRSPSSGTRAIQLRTARGPRLSKVTETKLKASLAGPARPQPWPASCPTPSSCGPCLHAHLRAEHIAPESSQNALYSMSSHIHSFDFQRGPVVLPLLALRDIALVVVLVLVVVVVHHQRPRA